ncbi:hypothetical protein NDU88_001307 [Pleurodeles waltl]|uniref:Uncharacterized protein n=1 Tax=Pleurodeles waltl TaxID=8319 RepID=A0AAV7KVZ5_PLEWA|nr:hypothetical protein NDU88_001307 [Pleurodeles waltl]
MRNIGSPNSCVLPFMWLYLLSFQKHYDERKINSKAIVFLLLCTRKLRVRIRFASPVDEMWSPRSARNARSSPAESAPRGLHAAAATGNPGVRAADGALPLGNELDGKGCRVHELTSSQSQYTATADESLSGAPLHPSLSRPVLRRGQRSPARAVPPRRAPDRVERSQSPEDETFLSFLYFGGLISSSGPCLGTLHRRAFKADSQPAKGVL